MSKHERSGFSKTKDRPPLVELNRNIDLEQFPVALNSHTTYGETLIQRFHRQINIGKNIFVFVGLPGAGKTQSLGELRAYRQALGYPGDLTDIYDFHYRSIRGSRPEELTDHQRIKVSQSMIREINSLRTDIHRRVGNDVLLFLELPIFGQKNRGNDVIEYLLQKNSDEVDVIAYAPDEALKNHTKMVRETFRTLLQQTQNMSVIREIIFSQFGIRLEEDVTYSVFKEKALGMASKNEMVSLEAETQELINQWLYDETTHIMSTEKLTQKKARLRSVQMPSYHTLTEESHDQARTALRSGLFKNQGFSEVCTNIMWITYIDTYLKTLGCKTAQTADDTQGNGCIVYNQYQPHAQIVYRLSK
jgi:hypothetical protein